MSSPSADNSSTRELGLVQDFLAAVHTQEPVAGLTHNFYRYPARFSPRFARAAIRMFSQPGDVVLDPFMGGATTLVEARALGRHAVGTDISSLAVFLAQVKTTVLTERELAQVAQWLGSLPEHLNLHLPVERAVEWHDQGYQRHVPWPIRKTIELALPRVRELRRKRQQRFARCLLLRVGQWAIDCRERIPSAGEFRMELFRQLDVFVEGMRDFRRAVRDHQLPECVPAKCVHMHCPAAALSDSPKIASLPKRPNLVVTSPPYPGVHVLYHRWNVFGRRESPAPFWVADCLDGQGAAHYSFGDRRAQGLRKYFEGIRESFEGVRSVVDQGALVVQMLAFAEPQWQIPRYLNAVAAAGFAEVRPATLGLPVTERIWRTVPGRRWFALIQGQLSTSQEVVLFHRAC